MATNEYSLNRLSNEGNSKKMKRERKKINNIIADSSSSIPEERKVDNSMFYVEVPNSLDEKQQSKTLSIEESPYQQKIEREPGVNIVARKDAIEYITKVKDSLKDSHVEEELDKEDNNYLMSDALLDLIQDPKISDKEFEKKLEKLQNIESNSPIISKIKEFCLAILEFLKDPFNKKKKASVATATEEVKEAIKAEHNNRMQNSRSSSVITNHPQSEVKRPTTLDTPPVKVIADQVVTPINNNSGGEIPPTNITLLSENNRILTPTEEKGHSWSKLGEAPTPQVKDPDPQEPPSPTSPPEIPPVSPPKPPVSPPVYSQDRTGSDLRERQVAEVVSSLEAPASIRDTIKTEPYHWSKIVSIPSRAPLKAEPVGHANNPSVPPLPPPLPPVVMRGAVAEGANHRKDLLREIGERQLKSAQDRVLSEPPLNTPKKNHMDPILAQLVKLQEKGTRQGPSEEKAVKASGGAASAFRKDQAEWVAREELDKKRQDENDKRNAQIDRKAEEDARKTIEEAEKKVESVPHNPKSIPLDADGKPLPPPPPPSSDWGTKKSPSPSAITEDKGKAQPSQNGLHLDKAAQAKIAQLYSGVAAELQERFNKQGSHLPQAPKLPRNLKKEEHAR